MPTIYYNTAKKVWVAVFKQHSKRVFRTSPTRSGAEMILAEALREKPQVDEYSYETIKANFLANTVGLKETTLRRYHFELSELDKLVPERITIENFANIITTIKTKVKSVSKQRRLIIRLKSLVQHLFVIPKNHFPKYEPRVGKALSPEQIRMLLQACVSNHYYSLVVFLLDTGCRLGEALALNWEDISNGVVTFGKTFNCANKGPKITSGKTKRSKRRVTLSKPISQLMERFRGLNDDPVFASPEGSRVSVNNLHKRFWKPLTLELNLDARIHDLRHTNATHLLNSGVDPRIVSARLGHSNVVTTLTIYDHLIIKDDKVAESTPVVGLL